MTKLMVVVCGVVVMLTAARSFADKGCGDLHPKTDDNIWEFEKQSSIRSFLCEDTKDPTSAALGWMDRPDKPMSEIARTWHVLSCIRPLKKDGYERETSKSMDNFSACAYDARRLDRAKVEAELKALGLEADLMTYGMKRFDKAKQLTDEYFAVAEAKAKGGSLAARMITVDIEKYAKEWEALYEANKARLELGYAIERKVVAHSVEARLKTKLKLGCEELRSSLREYATAKKPKNKEEIKQALTDPVSYVMLERLAMCDVYEGRYSDGAVASALLKENAYQSGPRNYILLALRKAAAKITDSPDWTIGGGPGDMKVKTIFNIDWGWEGKLNAVHVADDSRAQLNSQGGSVILARVASAKKSGDIVQLTFKKEKWDVPDMSCTSSGKINQWSFSGQPIYQETCKITGWHKVELQHDPDSVTLASGGTLKAGQMARMVQTSAKDSDAKLGPTTVVVEVLESVKGNKEPVTISYFGVPVSK